MNYELHPLCTLFPRLTGAEFEFLKEDIKVNGLRQPIVLHEGMILDGGNRYRACIDAGIDPEFIEFDGSNLVSFVLSANLHRRHLTPGQQAAIVSSAQDWAISQTHGGNRSSAHESTCSLSTTKERAASSGASMATQRRADAVAKANPELAMKVAHGEVSLQTAVREVAPQLAARKKSEALPIEQEEQKLSEDSITGDDAYGDELDIEAEYIAATHKIDELLKEVDRLTAIIEMDDKGAEINRLNALCDSLKTRIDSLMVEKNELIRTAKGYKIKLTQLEKQCNAAGLVNF